MRTQHLFQEVFEDMFKANPVVFILVAVAALAIATYIWYLFLKD